MTQFFHSKWIFATVLLGLLTACLPDIQEVKIERDKIKVAVPLIDSKTNLDNLFGKLGRSDNIIIYSNGNLGFVYSGNVVEIKGRDLFKSFGQLAFSLSQSETNINIPIPDQELVEGKIEGDTMLFLFQGNPDKSPLDFKLTMPTMISPAGDPLEIKVHYNGQQVLKKQAIGGYTFGFNQGNNFPVNVDARDDQGQKVEDFGTVWLAYDTLYFSYIKGYFGKDDYELPQDTVVIDIFDQLEEGGVFFNDPKVTVEIENSFGFPVNATAQRLKVLNKKHQEFTLSSPLIDNGIELQYPNLQEVGQTKKTLFEFDKSNSNIYDVFNANPTRLIYKFNGVGNPDPNNPTIGFATDSSFLRMNVRVELPIDGWVDRFVISKKSDWSWDPGDLSKLDSVTIKSIFNNGLPVELNTQVYLLKDDEVIDSIFRPSAWEIQGAPIDGDGYSSGLTESRNSIKVGRKVIEHMAEANYARYKVKVSTKNAPQRNSIIRKTDEFELKLGVLAQF